MSIRHGALLCTLSAALSCFAQGAGDLTKAGQTALDRKDFKGAETLFRQALAAKADDAEAHEGLGIALAREGNYAAALPEMQRARQLGLQHPEMDLEEGRALYFEKKYPEAIDLLVGYRKAHPGWQVDELLAMAYYRARRYAESIEAWKRFEAPDAQHRQVAAYYTAACEQALGKGSEAAAALKQTQEMGPGTRYGQAAEVLLALRSLPRPAAEENAFRRERPEHPWYVSGTVQGEYDTRPLGLGEIVGAPGTSLRDTMAFGLSAEGGYTLDLGRDTELNLDGGLFADFHDHGTGIDELLLEGNSTLTHWFSDRVSAGVTLGIEHLWLDGAPAATDWGPGVYGAFTEAGWTRTVVSYAFRDNEYDPQNPTPQANPDTDAHTVSIRQDFAIPRTDWRLFAGYAYTRADAGGSDFDADYHTATVGASHPLFWKIVGLAEFSYTKGDYDHPNSLDTVPFADTRNDDIFRGVVRIERPIGEHIHAFVQGSFIGADSSIPLYDYERQIATFGVAIHY